jgi:hypothetical protein
MKAFIIKIFSVCLLTYTGNIMASIPNKKITQLTYPLQKRYTTPIKLTGLYILKFTNTPIKKEWRKTTSVGLEFFPDTYMYSTGKLLFDTVKQKVSMSSISSIPSLPSIDHGSYKYKEKGDDLTIVYNNPKNYGQFKIILASIHWLVLEDKRTKTQWKFYKK